jgi:hypothetical protein
LKRGKEVFLKNSGGGQDPKGMGEKMPYKEKNYIIS